MEDVLSLCQERYEEQKEALGMNQEGRLAVHQSQALALAGLSRYNESIKMSQELIDEMEKTIGVDDYLTIKTMGSLAAVLQLNKNLEEALRVC